jgi:methionyl-tRNA formyltransferase
MKIAIIGRSQILYDTALELNKKGHSIVAIVTAKAAPEYTRKEKDFRLLARRLKAKYILGNSLEKMDSFSQAVRGSDLGVSFNWVSVVKQKQINLFKIGILNAHMGDLPRYRGNACPNWAILEGEKEIVISVHLMEGSCLDCGRVILQDRLRLKKNTYIKDVYSWAEKVIPDMFVKAAEILRKNPGFTLKYAGIKSSDSLRCYPRRPQDSRIIWQESADKILRLIRASSHPFSGAYCFLNRKKMVIWKARALKDSERYLACAGQICAVGKRSFSVITGSGKIMVTGWTCPVKVKSIRQRLT